MVCFNDILYSMSVFVARRLPNRSNYFFYFVKVKNILLDVVVQTAHV